MTDTEAEKYVKLIYYVMKDYPNYPNKEEFDILQFKRFIKNLLFKTMQTMLKEKSFTLVTYQKPNRIKEMYED